MVCSLGSGKMAAFARLLVAGSVLKTGTEEAGHQKLAAQYIQKELRDADEANLLDEEDMNIFGLRPMADPLHLVRCNTCKKPIKVNQFGAHAELCKSLTSREEIIPELDGAAVIKRPPRKERKKLLIAHTNQPTLLREHKIFQLVDSTDTAVPESHLDRQIQMAPPADAKVNTPVSGTQYMNGSRVCPITIESSEKVTLPSSKPFKRTAAENPSDPGTKSLCVTTPEVSPYVPAPLATKIYYSQRNRNLRRVICHMYYGESSKECSRGVSKLDLLKVNSVPTQTTPPGNIYPEPVVKQQRNGHLLHPASTPDQIISSNSKAYLGKSSNISSQLPVNNTVGPYHISNSLAYVGKSGTSIPAALGGNHLGGTVQ